MPIGGPPAAKPLARAATHSQAACKGGRPWPGPLQGQRLTAKQPPAARLHAGMAPWVGPYRGRVRSPVGATAHVLGQPLPVHSTATNVGVVAAAHWIEQRD
ncbi:hypothetical protein B296_00029288 [Ensete ventricosum]|uniref:Uncharacterized protein n=1 Tax=Ensete ventricosum TaxID=4639 RepID=A0A427AL53_ENSVE|nr:hypothetical protein B296_00029288 [Ensete ventricosum]